ncbi:MAG: spondin domain-containing protein, partial [Gemmatimonadaceae bacterium]
VLSRGGLSAQERDLVTYQITIENLKGGQPFSPGVIATHTKQVDVWGVGSRPSPLIINIAENGLVDAGLTAAHFADLRARPGVFDVVMTAPTDDHTPPIVDGAPDPPSVRTYTIEAAANANHLSVAVMIICTNDGFTGVSSVRLPGGFKPVTFATVAYDAGTETNTEQYTDIVDPCQLLGPDPGPPAVPNGNNNNLPEDGGVIRHHAGIQGVAVDVGLDPSLHNWTAPVARITVQRVK